MATTVPRQNGQVRELTLQQGKDLLDQRARHYLHLTADEFLRKWDAGDYRGDDRPEVMRVVMAIPFARR
jgi:hypothetical protein